MRDEEPTLARGLTNHGLSLLAGKRKARLGRLYVEQEGSADFKRDGREGHAVREAGFIHTVEPSGCVSAIRNEWLTLSTVCWFKASLAFLLRPDLIWTHLTLKHKIWWSPEEVPTRSTPRPSFHDDTRAGILTSLLSALDGCQRRQSLQSMEKARVALRRGPGTSDLWATPPVLVDRSSPGLQPGPLLGGAACLP